MPSGIKIKDLVVGTGVEAVRGKIAYAHVRMTLNRGDVLHDSVANGKPIRINLGRRDEMAGLQKGIEGRSSLYTFINGFLRPHLEVVFRSDGAGVTGRQTDEARFNDCRKSGGIAIIIICIVCIMLGVALLVWIRMSPTDRLQTRQTKLRSSVTATMGMKTALKIALDEFAKQKGTYPSQPEGFKALVDAGICDHPQPIDAWGTPFRYTMVGGKPIITSAGPDKSFDTKDDLK